jgi:sugar phosphate isomerase/epimerase
MKKSISVQLYTVREAIEKDYVGTIRKLAKMGFDAVEPAGFPGITPKEAKKLFNELSLKSYSMHSALPLGDNKNQVIEEALEIEAKYLYTGCSPNFQDDFNSIDSIKKCADIYSEASINAKKYGLKVGYHNHDWEMVDFDNMPAYRLFLDFAAPEVLWEIDTYWVTVGKKNVVEVVKDIGTRAPVIHIKDGTLIKGDAMLAAGKGKMDIPGILKASTADIFVVELDCCDTDMLDAVEESYNYISNIL